MLQWKEEQAQNRPVVLDEGLDVRPSSVPIPRQRGVVECPEDLEQFVGYTFTTKTPGSSEIESFTVEKVVHSSRRGTQIWIVYADDEQDALSAKEFDKLMDTVIEWPNGF
jgi:hypothetical protein